jgi:dienelactone hydrolase
MELSPEMTEQLLDRLKVAFETGQHPLRFVSATVEQGETCIVERLVFKARDGETVNGILTRPHGEGPWPGIMCIHAHGARYDIGVAEMLAGRPALQSPPGPAFADAGFAAFMIELPAFGARAQPGESSRAKAALWQGRSLAGQMLGELHSALDWFAGHDAVNAQHIGVYGISMGATLGYWLAAVEPRLACVAHLCCYADFGDLIRTGAHDLHGIYLSVPDLLDIATNGTIAGMIAPRPQLICIGDRDPLTPSKAVDIALAETRAAYASAGAEGRLILHREPGTAHVETAAMREAVLDFFNTHLI